MSIRDWFIIKVFCVAVVALAFPSPIRAMPIRYTKLLSSSRILEAPLYRMNTGTGRSIPGEYIVKLKSDISDDDVNKFERTFSKICKKKGLRLDVKFNLTKVMKGFTAKMSPDAVSILRWMDEVDFVEEDSVVSLDSIPWGLDRIDQTHLPLDNVYDPSPLGDGSNVHVFVLDTGIHFSHLEFEGRASNFFDVINPDSDQSGNDCHGHGTHCAAIVGGKHVGVAPGVTLHSVRTLRCNGQGSASNTIEGMEEIAYSGLKPGVVSLSVGSGHSAALNQAATSLVNAGYIVVAAAGNTGTDACGRSPGSAEAVITVGATNKSDKLAYYSNYGDCVDVLAPGSRIYSATYREHDNNRYKRLSGTSMAAPHVAGVAALLLQRDATLNQAQVKDLLVNMAEVDLIDLSKLTPTQRSSMPNLLLNVHISTER